ncbi:MAG: AAA family ATPase [Deltaproteobacteria bacterium]|jgi:hypothetical protein|nr:AAA family ATPase [Deltaproteobacteria bacterium]
MEEITRRPENSEDAAMDRLPPLPMSQGIFQELRSDGCVYVDKTDFVRLLLEDNRKAVFLSRPRRFGKTLLLSTIEAAIQGREDLFRGLKISHDSKQFDWKRSHVISLSLSTGVRPNKEFEESLMNQLHNIADDFGVSIVSETSDFAIIELINTLFKSYGDIQLRCNGNGVSIDGKEAFADHQKVSVLIDESDFPLISFFNDPARLKSAQSTLSAFYTALKDVRQKGRLGLLLVTGITRFKELFMDSAMNILYDLTFDPKYSNICGFSADEIDKYLKNHLSASLLARKSMPEAKQHLSVEELFSDIKDWYDGYSWDGESEVLNPHSILNFLTSYSLERYWYDTGAPGFLRRLEVHDGDYFKIYAKNNFCSEIVKAKDITSLSAPAALLMTGYLSVGKIDFAGKSDGEKQYYLTIPNEEVRSSFVADHLLDRLYPGVTENDINKMLNFYKKFSASLSILDVDRLTEILSSILEIYPYQRIESNERFFQNEIARCLWFLNDVVQAEPSAGGGVPDFIVRLPGSVIIIDVKHARSIHLINGLKGELVHDDSLEPDAHVKTSECHNDRTKDDDGVESSNPTESVPERQSRAIRIRRTEAHLARVRKLLEKGISEAFTQIYVYKHGWGDLGGKAKVYAVAVSVVDRIDVMIDCREILYRDWRNDPRPKPLGRSEI